jgi:hypothetical protein
MQKEKIRSLPMDQRLISSKFAALDVASHLEVFRLFWKAGSPEVLLKDIKASIVH